ncbi:MAG: GTP-binding protein [Myxococcota bacterium]|nr:GTP-binding protein [Myxococcota bacterium]
MNERNEEQPDRKVPALVVSGFLGSGKTTLIRRILDDAIRDGVRVALVSNELGALGIDRALLGQGGDAYVEIEGGCVCCELSDDLIETLQELWEKVRPDRVVIETSGVALPFDTQLNFWREPVCRWLGDDMAVVVVNAEQVAEGRDLEGTFSDQVTSADLIVLNKVDLVSDEALARARETLQRIEPEAPILLATQADVPSDLLFPPEFLDTARAPDRSGPRPASRPHSHEHFETEIWEVPDGLNEEAIEAHLAQPGLLRAKGFVRTSAGVQLVQVVGRRIEIQPGEEPIAPELVGRIVLIRRAP